MIKARGARRPDNGGALSGYALPGDELIPRPSYAATRWLPVAAPPAIVWACLLQSAGGGAELAWRSGDIVLLSPRSPFWVEAIRPEHWVVLASYSVPVDVSVAVVLAAMGGQSTWLGVRLRLGCYGPWQRPLALLARTFARDLVGRGMGRLKRRAEHRCAVRDR